VVENYHLDPVRYSIQQFEDNLASREMIPSRMILKEDLESRFDKLRALGLETLGDLLQALKTKSKIAALAEKSGIPERYLIILNREAKSYFPNPVRLDQFSGFSPSVIQALRDQGITHSRHLFERAQNPEERVEQARKTGISMELISELLCLSDLVRLYGFGPVFARLVYDVGIRTVEEILQYTPQQVIEIYERESGQKADFSPDDIQFSLEVARFLDLAVQLDPLSKD
jgi:hypothetical protein